MQKGLPCHARPLVMLFDLTVPAPTRLLPLELPYQLVHLAVGPRRRLE
jgi:hypothetical protein